MRSLGTLFSMPRRLSDGFASINLLRKLSMHASTGFFPMTAALGGLEECSALGSVYFDARSLIRYF